MKNSEIFQRNPSTSKLLNDGVAAVSEGSTQKEIDTLRYELEHFVCEGQYKEGMIRILESFNIATLIQAADAAAKAANITLLEIRLAMALGGKAFCTLTGDVSAVQSAIEAGRKLIAEAGTLVNAVVISRPHPDVYREII